MKRPIYKGFRITRNITKKNIFHNNIFKHSENQTINYYEKKIIEFLYSIILIYSLILRILQDNTEVKMIKLNEIKPRTNNLTGSRKNTKRIKPFGGCGNYKSSTFMYVHEGRKKT